MSAEFRVLCHSLGLGAKGLADYVRVSTRSAEYWLANGEPPQGVLEDILRLDASIQDTIQQTVNRYMDVAHDKEPQEVALEAYRSAEAWHAAHPEYKPLPAQTHSIMLARTRQALANIGLKTIIRYADVQPR